jgi:hypothetical protein
MAIAGTNMTGIRLNRVIGSDLLWLRITRMKPSSESEGTHLGNPGLTRVAARPRLASNRGHPRKNAFGSHSESGCRFAERMLTVVQTLRLQKRHVVNYLHHALAAHRSGLPAPVLLIDTRN